MRPSIMSDGAMISQPASAWTSAWRTSTVERRIVVDIAVPDQPVMAVAGVGIERHVAQHADLGHRLLDRAHRAADQIVGVDRFASVLGLQGRVGGREKARSPGCPASPLLPPRRPPDRPTSRSTPGMEATASRFFSPSIRKIGQIRSAGDNVFSATRRRVQSWRRRRRMRSRGIATHRCFPFMPARPDGKPVAWLARSAFPGRRPPRGGIGAHGAMSCQFGPPAQVRGLSRP